MNRPGVGGGGYDLRGEPMETVIAQALEHESCTAVADIDLGIF